MRRLLLEVLFRRLGETFKATTTAMAVVAAGDDDDDHQRRPPRRCIVAVLGSIEDITKCTAKTRLLVFF